ncbi:MAG: hypothetical protein U0R71_09625 [Solirubrobacterales bacterium]
MSEQDSKPVGGEVPAGVAGAAPTTSTVAPPGFYEPCETCGAPMDAQQRYCVNCAARRPNGANPSSRYFAAMSKKARRPLTATPRRKPQTSRAAAVGFFALLPIAVALGVVVGRSDSGGEDNAALLRALQSQQGSAAVASTEPGATTTAKTKKKAAAKTDSGKPKTKKQEVAAEKKSVVAKTKNGTVHDVTKFEASKEKEEKDTKLVEENPEQAGENYIKAQQNLEDVTVIGGDGSTAPAPSGAEP